jgi:uncharacterized Ntn-hydrolase superfamily protein
VLVIDAQGTTALRSGSESLGTVGSAFGNSVIAAGNMLATDQVPRAMVTGFDHERGPLEMRLLSALRAAVVAGAEAGPIHSAGIAVVTDVGWRVTDLRVDWHDDPVEELARVLSVWLPQRADYITRAIDPSLSVGYGVPGGDRH